MLLVSRLFFIHLALCVAINMGCSRQKNCITAYKEANDAYLNFNIAEDSALLLHSLGLAEQAISCPETKKLATRLKISILVRQGKIDNALAFIESVDETHFFYPYVRKTTYYFVRGYSLEEGGDSIEAKRNYGIAANYIQRYIDSVTYVQVEEKILYELYSTKLMFKSFEQVKQEIDSLSGKFPQRKNTFDDLVNFFDPQRMH